MLRRASLRYHLRQPWQAALAVLGVALGVAVVVAVQLANTSAERAFQRSAEALQGEATHRVSAGTAGLDEALYTELRRAGIDTLAMGGGAALLAFLLGFVFEPMLGNLQIG